MIVSILLSFCIFMIGCSIGSFINMAAYRIPRYLSIVKPRSYCNKCKTELSFLALIPFFGYFLTKGQCMKCNMRIPFVYPLIELLCGLFFVFGWYHYDENFSLPFFTLLWLFSTGLLLSIIDIKHRILPDVIVIPGIVANLILGSLNPNLGFVQSLLGILVAGVGLYLISKLYEYVRHKEGMGFGDVKYLAFLGAILGWSGAILSLFVASVIGSVVGISILLVQRKTLHTPIPFGPFLALGGVLCFFMQISIF